MYKKTAHHVATSIIGDLQSYSLRTLQRPIGLHLSSHIVSMAPNRTKTVNGGLSTAARENQNDENASEKFTKIREGLADIFVPKSSSEKFNSNDGDHAKSTQSVFYNPIQQFNRDLSVLAIKAFGEDLLTVRSAKAESKVPRGRKRKRQVQNDQDTETASKEEISTSIESPKVQNSQVDNSYPHPGKAILTTELPLDSPFEIEEGRKNEVPPSVDPRAVTPRQQKFKILDALSASGLRAVRYAKEIPQTTSITANDMSIEATASIAANVKLNVLEDKIEVTTSNAMSHLYNCASSPNGKYDVIDLDPYGTAVPFLDASMQAINDGGLLCVTCTDAGVWASCGYPEKTYALYGGFPIKGQHSHEGGLRLILHAIASSAAKYGLAIEPLLSLSIDFYARIFVRVFRSQSEVKLLAGKTMLVYSCDAGCGAWTVQPLAQNKTFEAKNGSLVYKHSLAQAPTSPQTCEHCSMKMHLSGPMYAGPLHNPAFIEAILKALPNLDCSIYETISRIEGMLYTALEETVLYNVKDIADGNNPDQKEGSRPVPRMDAAKVDHNPFFFIPSALAGVIHCQAPPEAALKGALKHAGYEVARSHTKPGSIKTNAPWSFIWDMMRAWESQKYPVRLETIKPRSAAWKILEDRIKQSGLDSNAEVVNASHSNPDDSMEPKSAQKPKIIFDEELGRDPNRGRFVRYQPNPRENWGPMARARGRSPRREQNLKTEREKH